MGIRSCTVLETIQIKLGNFATIFAVWLPCYLFPLPYFLVLSLFHLISFSFGINIVLLYFVPSKILFFANVSLQCLYQYPIMNNKWGFHRNCTHIFSIYQEKLFYNNLHSALCSSVCYKNIDALKYSILF